MFVCWACLIIYRECWCKVHLLLFVAFWTGNRINQHLRSGNHLPKCGCGILQDDNEGDSVTHLKLPVKSLSVINVTKKLLLDPNSCGNSTNQGLIKSQWAKETGDVKMQCSWSHRINIKMTKKEEVGASSTLTNYQKQQSWPCLNNRGFSFGLI